MDKMIPSSNEVETREKLIDFGFNGEKDHLREVYEGYGLLDDTGFNAVSPPIQECFKELATLNAIEDVVEHQKKAKDQYSYSPALLRILKDYGNGLTRLSGSKRIKPSDGYISIEATKTISTTTTTSGRLSAEETMRLAGEKLVQSYSRTLGGLSGSTVSYNLSSLGLSDQDIKNVQLAELLLAAAEKISQEQYGFASRLLDRCDSYSNHAGNPVERVTYYFSESLRERMDRETGRESDKGIGRKGSFNIEEAVMTNLSTMASYGGTPFPRIAQFAGIQAIIESVIEAKKIHIIDIGIRFGSQWILLIEALAERPDFQLRITAVGTISKAALEGTGKRLMRFAESKKVAFSFKVVVVSDILELKEELLNVDPDETVAVYSPYVLKSMLATPDRLEHMMKLIAEISPVVTVIIESDANLNSSAFVSRFIEAVFFFSTYFDCLGECLGHDEKSRRIMEGVFYAEGIRNIVVMEGEERKIRNVRMEVWRAFIKRYGLEETEFSMSSLYQANLLLKQSPMWSQHCTLKKNVGDEKRQQDGVQQFSTGSQ